MDVETIGEKLFLKNTFPNEKVEQYHKISFEIFFKWQQNRLNFNSKCKPQQSIHIQSHEMEKLSLKIKTNQDQLEASIDIPWVIIRNPGWRVCVH